MIFRSLLSAVALSLAITACGWGGSAELDGFDTATVTIDGRELAVAVAETPALRSQGLMGVTDLGGLDGMLFIFDTSVDTGFWMKDTLIPLDIAFFGTDGGFVSRDTMYPCIKDPCPVYRPSSEYRYALEAPAGDLSSVGEGSILETDGD